MLITMTKLNDLQHGEGTRAFPGCGLQTPWQWEHDVKVHEAFRWEGSSWTLKLASLGGFPVQEYSLDLNKACAREQA